MSDVKFEKVGGQHKLILTNGAADRFDAQKRKLESLIGKKITDEEAMSQMLGDLTLEKSA
jgi:hypothetical protein